VSWFVATLRSNPELAIFLTLALGFFIGRLRVRRFSLGTVVGTLLAGVLVGQLDIQVPAIIKTVFFDLFLFTTGYKVGPQFFRGLRHDAVSQVVLASLLCVTCLLSAFTASRLLGYDVGTAAGLLGGAFSESTVIGTAGQAIDRLAIPADEKTRLVNNIPVAYAVTYLLGTVVLVWFLPVIGPKLMGIDLKTESKRMQAQASAAAELEPGVVSPVRRLEMRAYELKNESLVDKTIAELESLRKDVPVFVLRIRRDGDIVDALPSMVIRLGDIIAVATRSGVLAEHDGRIGPEVDDRALLDIPIEVLDVVVTNRMLAGRTLAELASREFARCVFLRKLARSGVEMPIAPETRVDRGDVLSLVGPRHEVERAGKELGYPDAPTHATDLIFVGSGIVLGELLGLLTITIAGVPITLTASGGALSIGLVFGWLRSVRPFFGRLPEPAIWIFDTVGLCVFIGVVGISAGPGFVTALRTTGISLAVVSVVCALVPHTVAILVGRYVLRMNPLIVLGACAGSGAIRAALRTVQDEAQSRVPALGYTVPYAVGNILLTAWGPVIVALTSMGRVP
jgi:putative transport protein